jgi:hypothetical protein
MPKYSVVSKSLSYKYTCVRKPFGIFFFANSM